MSVGIVCFLVKEMDMVARGIHGIKNGELSPMGLKEQCKYSLYKIWNIYVKLMLEMWVLWV